MSQLLDPKLHFLRKNHFRIVFVPTVAQGVTLSVCLSIRAGQVCLNQSIFIFLGQRAIREHSVIIKIRVMQLEPLSTSSCFRLISCQKSDHELGWSISFKLICLLCAGTFYLNANKLPFNLYQILDFGCHCPIYCYAILKKNKFI